MKILVTGGTGMVGNTFLTKKDSNEYILVGSREYDLTNFSEAKRMIFDEKPDAVIHLAAKVGGLKGNTDFVADFYQENVLINTNVLTSCVKNGIEKVVSLLSTCIYPDSAVYPLTPEQIHSGEPHHSNFGYAYAKRMLEVHSRAIKKQYGFTYTTAVPNNIYGPNDNFHYEYSHVIPAMIRKIYEGKLSNKEVVLWGDGKPLREFTFSDDITDILSWMIENYTDITPLNIGNTQEYPISEVAKVICNHIGYDYQDIKWDVSKPTGQHRKPSSNQRLLSLKKEQTYTTLQEGLGITCNWFMETYPNIRGKS